MDIGSINSNYLSQASSSASTASSEAEKAVSRNYSGSTDEEMMDACKKFESYFIEQVLKEVKKTIPKEEKLDQATDSLVDFFKDNMVQEFSEKIQETNSIGLAQQMYEQMKRNYSNTVPVSELENK